jgi:hypothetical protein
MDLGDVGISIHDHGSRSLVGRLDDYTGVGAELNQCSAEGRCKVVTSGVKSNGVVVEGVLAENCLGCVDDALYGMESGTADVMVRRCPCTGGNESSAVEIEIGIVVLEVIPEFQVAY